MVDQVVVGTVACTHFDVAYLDAYLDSLDYPVVESWPGLNDTFSDYYFRYCLCRLVHWPAAVETTGDYCWSS